MKRVRAKRVTQADIARHAGVSTAVVSLVLNNAVHGNVRVSPSTQQRVRESMNKLGYVPNSAARQLARGRTNTIGVFTYEPIFPLASTNFYQPFLIGIEEAATQLNYNLLLLTGGVRDGKRKIYDNGANRLFAAEGAVLLGTNEDREELKQLWESGYPFVFVGRRQVDGHNIPSSAADYEQASQHLVSHVAAQGHRNIMVMRHGTHSESEIDRFKGVRAAIAAHPEVTFHHFEKNTNEVSREWLVEQLDLGVTAFICAATPPAVNLIHLAEQMDLRVPEDISVAALGNADNPQIFFEGLTTFLIPHREMGSAAVRLLSDILASKDPPLYPITIPCTFVPGTTVAPPRTVSMEKGVPQRSVSG